MCYKKFIFINIFFLFLLTVSPLYGKTSFQIEKAIKVFSAVPFQSSSAFKENIYPELLVDTYTYDRTPYYMTDSFTCVLNIQEGQHCFLAGDREGKTGWSVDNFILLEIEADSEVEYYVIGKIGNQAYFKGIQLNK